MLFSAFRNPAIRFIVFGSLLYLGLYFFYELYIKPHTLIDEYIINSLVSISETVLRFFGYELIDYSSSPIQERIGISGSSGLFIGEPCNGFTLFILFLSFIFAFPGPIKHKLWYIPLGILFTHLINALRVIALVIIAYMKPEWLNFNHDYTFTIIVYAFVFMLWWIWINKFSSMRKTQNPEKA